jgi:SAM-dependent methyltransferase
MVNRNGLHTLYAQIAARYETEVIPVFAPLAADFARWIAACSSAYLDGILENPFDVEVRTTKPHPSVATMTALDVGTGTGILARQLADVVQSVVGIDLSAAMVAAAPLHQHVMILTADAHQLPFRVGSFRMAASSFGLNTTTPKQSLREITRVLRPNGGLCFLQEWGAMDDLARVADDLLRERQPDDFEIADDDLQAFLSEDSPWYAQLSDADDYFDSFRRLGYQHVWVREASFVKVEVSIEAFMRYKLAWPSRRLPYLAMSEPQRNAFDSGFREQVQQHSYDGKHVIWSPSLIRAFAVKG